MGTVLTTPTYDGSGQATHPSVIKVGSTFYMAMTPYPNADNTKENPSVLESTDGTTWSVPSGLTNPVDAQPSPGFNSDTELVYDDGTFYLFYRDVVPPTERLLLRTSTDIVTWGDEVELLSMTLTSERALSPAVVKRGDTWHMWTVDIVPAPNVIEHRTAPAASGPWSSPTTLALTDPEERELWHLSVVLDHGLYRMFLTTSSNDNGSAGRLILGTSVDGETWMMNDAATISPSSGWESDSIYRATGVREDDTWTVWYGGVDASNNWRIGYDTLDADDFPAGRPAVPSMDGAASAWPTLRP